MNRHFLYFLSSSFCLVAASAIAACSGGGNSNNGAAPGVNPDGEDGGASSNNNSDADAGKPLDPTDPFAACKGVEFQNAGTFDVDLKAVRVRGKVTVDGAASSFPEEAGRVTFTLKAPGAKGAAATTITAAGQYETTLTPGTYDIGYAPDTQACASSTSTSAWPCNGHVIKEAVAITKDGVVDLDLATVVVRGAVKLKGQAWPGTSGYPSVVFSETTPTGAGTGTGTAGTAAVALSSATGYSTRLFKGTYDVAYAPRTTTCSAFVPCNSGIVKQGANLTANGVLDLDVPMIIVRGLVSLDGTPMTATTRGGSMSFAVATPAGGTTGTKKTASAATASIGTDGRYAVALFPETYNVIYSGVSSSGSSTSPLPRGPGMIRPNASLKTDGTLDLDVPTATVRGNVRVNGTQLSPATGGGASHGTLTFTAKDLGGAANATVLADGTYSTVVVAGATYDVGYSPSSGSCVEGELGEEVDVTPCNGGVLKTGLMLAKGAAGALDLDMKVVKLQGSVSLNGAKITNALALSSSTPSITFATPGTAAPADENGLPAAKPFATGITELGTYSTRLLAGTYDVGYGGARCEVIGEIEEIALPCNSGTVRPAVALSSNGALDVDVLAAIVQGKVTLGGQAVPATPMERGSLSFIGKTAGTTSTDPFGTDGPVTYKTHLLRGRYVVFYNPSNQCTDLDTGTTSPMPCMGTVLAGCEQ